MLENTGSAPNGYASLISDAILDLVAQTATPTSITNAISVKVIRETDNATTSFGHSTLHIWRGATDNALYVANARGTSIPTVIYKTILGGPTGPEGPESTAVGGEDNVQADWSETDTADDAFIQNKPTVPSSFAPTDAERNVRSDWDENNTNNDAHILNRPTIPTVPSQYAPTNAEQNVKSDWDASSGDAEILNKPTIPVVPSQHAPVNAEQNVKSDWNATSGDAQIIK